MPMGGHFAIGKTYAEVLELFSERSSTSANQRRTIAEEANRADLPKTQQEMLASFSRNIEQRPTPQLELLLGI